MKYLFYLLILVFLYSSCNDLRVIDEDSSTMKDSELSSIHENIHNSSLNCDTLPGHIHTEMTIKTLKHYRIWDSLNLSDSEIYYRLFNDIFIDLYSELYDYPKIDLIEFSNQLGINETSISTWSIYNVPFQSEHDSLLFIDIMNIVNISKTNEEFLSSIISYQDNNPLNIDSKILCPVIDISKSSFTFWNVNQHLLLDSTTYYQLFLLRENEGVSARFLDTIIDPYDSDVRGKIIGGDVKGAINGGIAGAIGGSVAGGIGSIPGAAGGAAFGGMMGTLTGTIHVIGDHYGWWPWSNGPNGGGSGGGAGGGSGGSGSVGGSGGSHLFWNPACGCLTPWWAL